MNSPDSNNCFADHVVFGELEVDANERIARDTYRLRLICPDIAQRIVPGQFLMVRLAGADDPLLGRPLALYDTVLDDAGRAIGIEIVYLVIGKMTGRLADYRKGKKIEVWGPLGNGFPSQSVETLVMVAGGIGQTPFLALAREYLQKRSYGSRTGGRAKKVVLCYGVRSSEYLAGIDEFSALGIDLRISTDDGSAGFHGMVTELVRPLLAGSSANSQVVCCGPERMMAAVAEIAAAAQAPCLVSLESPMACGLGICFSCVVRVRQPNGDWDYRRSCVEGPVFNAADIDFSTVD